MVKRLFQFVLCASVLFIVASCDKDDAILSEPVSDSDIPEAPSEDPESMVVDLSESGMANCYIVRSPGHYKFKADNQFNLGEGLPVPPKIYPVKATLVWQTEPSLISAVELMDIDSETVPYVCFEVSEARGNALIAVLDIEGDIVWSWHIWMPETEPTSMPTATGYEVMTMNLGAMNNIPGTPESYGMLYQWGRKDPFPASPTLTGTSATVGAPLYDMQGDGVSIINSSWYNTDCNTQAYATSHPTVCLSNSAQYASSRDWLESSQSDDSLWGNPDGNIRDSETNTYPNKGRKTCYDPSPAGWRVAPADAFRNLTSSGGYAWVIDDFAIADSNNDGEVNIEDYCFGWHFMVSDGKPLYFPAAARYDGTYAMLMGSMSGLWGNYWSNASHAGMSGGAVCALAFQIKDMYGNDAVTVSPSGSASRADAYSIRCIRDDSPAH